jgi:V/A-type H+-transporting ATPase subunit I
MLVGDEAYGAIFLAVTWLLRKKLPRSWYVLMLVFSSATIVWGVLSNTWFGAQLPFLASLPAAQWLADPSYRNMMFLCFTIGVSHLMLARLWNAVCRLPDSTSIAEFGWAGILLFMYFVTNFIVGIFLSIPGWAYVLFSISLFCVFAFMLKPKEFKSRGAELGMLPLNIMSALGDII